MTPKVKPSLVVSSFALLSQLLFCNFVFAEFYNTDKGYRPETTVMYDHVLQLTADLENGKRLFSICQSCHLKEEYDYKQQEHFIPQLGGQHRLVLIKQLTDFISGKRFNQIMSSVIMDKHLGNAQNVADVAAYASSLSATTHAVGLANDLELGKDLYRVHCIKCHGSNGQGDNEKLIPRLQGQHYHYMLSQFIRVKNGQRHNTDIRMRRQIEGFTYREMQAVIDYASRLNAK